MTNARKLRAVLLASFVVVVFGMASAEDTTFAEGPAMLLLCPYSCFLGTWLEMPQGTMRFFAFLLLAGEVVGYGLALRTAWLRGKLFFAIIALTAFHLVVLGLAIRAIFSGMC